MLALKRRQKVGLVRGVNSKELTKLFSFVDRTLPHGSKTYYWEQEEDSKQIPSNQMLQSRQCHNIYHGTFWCQNKLSFLPGLLILLLQTQVPGLKASGITMNLNLALVKIASPDRSRKGMSSHTYGEVIIGGNFGDSLETCRQVMSYFFFPKGWTGSK